MAAARPAPLKIVASERLTPFALPPGAMWRAATARERRDYLRIASEVMRTAWISRVNSGRGAGIQSLLPRQKPRRDGASGPVLVPHGAQSRAIRDLIAGHTDREAWITWRGEIGVILAYHKMGVWTRFGPRGAVGGRTAPKFRPGMRKVVRDVTDFPREVWGDIRDAAMLRWPRPAAYRGPEVVGLIGQKAAHIDTPPPTPAPKSWTGRASEKVRGLLARLGGRR